jgi:uncharacterized protein YbjT (DUF2867 family)
MKIVVIGGTGLIGSQVTEQLTARGHEVLPAAPSTGVNTFTGEGLEGALVGATVVIDVSNSPSFAADDVLAFFQRSGEHLAAAEKVAGVTHHVALTIVGAERAPDSGYLRAKIAQESVIKSAGVPFTIVRATQFFEFLPAIADAATADGVVRVPAAALQPIAASDVVAALAGVALAAPANATIEIAGPQALPLPDLLRPVLAARGDARLVVGEEHGQYFGTELTDATLTAGPQAHIGATTFAAWLATQNTTRTS